MPTCVPDASLPRPSTPRTHLVRTGVEFRVPRSCVMCGQIDVDFAGKRSVKVVDIHAAVLASAIYVSRVGASGGGEVASNEGLEHAVTTKRD